MNNQDWTKVQRQVAGALGVIVAAGLIFQTTLTAQNRMKDGASLLEALFQSSGYFTLWTNALVAVVCICVATGRPARNSKAARILVAGSACQIALVGIIYHALLASQWELKGLWVYSDFLVHTFAPIAMVIFWLWAGSHQKLAISDAAWWLVWSGLYTAQALIRGAITGWYPYFFLDAGTLGWPAVAINIVGLTGVFFVSGLVFVGAGRLVARLTPSDQAGALKTPNL
jgi:hypothetical protein